MKRKFNQYFADSHVKIMIYLCKRVQNSTLSSRLFFVFGKQMTQ
jgi:hypothetical protein